MNCHRCGQPLTTNAISCGHCGRIDAKTRVFVDPASRQTQMLVQVERCANCGFLVYPGDTECSACGTWINRAWKQPGGGAKNRAVPANIVWIGVAISLIVVAGLAVVWRLLGRL